MLISELQEQLEAIKLEHGDVPVICNIGGLRREILETDIFPCGGISFMLPVDHPDFDSHGGFVKNPSVLIGGF